MGNSAVKEHFATASKTGVFKLSDRLDKFPSKLYELSSVIRSLDLSENRLCELPDDIDKFKILKHLRLNKNRLAVIPESVGALLKLESISLSDNSLRSIPLSFGNLTHLTKINMSGNCLSELPDVFSQLHRLDVLDLSRNLLQNIPDHVQFVQAVELILNQNQISQLSEKIAQCPRLRTLRLEENCLSLSAIPRALLKDSTVAVLTLEGNLFEMKQLTDTDGYSDYMDRYTAMKKKMF